MKDNTNKKSWPVYAYMSLTHQSLIELLVRLPYVEKIREVNFDRSTKPLCITIQGNRSCPHSRAVHTRLWSCLVSEAL